MNLIPSLTSGCNGACRSPELGSLLFIDFHVTTFVLLPTSAPARIISAKVWNGLGFVACKYFFEQVHFMMSTKPMRKSKACFMSCHLPALRPLHNCHFPVMRRQAQILILKILYVFLRLTFSPSLPDKKMSRSAKVSLIRDFPISFLAMPSSPMSNLFPLISIFLLIFYLYL